MFSSFFLTYSRYRPLLPTSICATGGRFIRRYNHEFIIVDRFFSVYSEQGQLLTQRNFDRKQYHGITSIRGLHVNEDGIFLLTENSIAHYSRLDNEITFLTSWRVDGNSWIGVYQHLIYTNSVWNRMEVFSLDGKLQKNCLWKLDHQSVHSLCMSKGEIFGVQKNEMIVVYSLDGIWLRSWKSKYKGTNWNLAVNENYVWLFGQTALGAMLQIFNKNGEIYRILEMDGFPVDYRHNYVVNSCRVGADEEGLYYLYDGIVFVYKM